MGRSGNGPVTREVVFHVTSRRCCVPKDPEFSGRSSSPATSRSKKTRIMTCTWASIFPSSTFLGNLLTFSSSIFPSGAGRAARKAPQGSRQLAMPEPRNPQESPRRILLLSALSSDRITRRAIGSFLDQVLDPLGECRSGEVCYGFILRLY